MSGDETSELVRSGAGSAFRSRWWIEVGLIGAVWLAYDAINNLNPLKATTALAHGMAIVHIETLLHLDPERGMNRWLAAHLVLGRWLGDYYDTAHLAVTVVVLAYLWWRYPHRYRVLRDALLGINVIGFIIFWAFPVAPPRMLTGLGFVDVVAITHSVGAWSSGTLASQANEYAAMPSLHVAWALWCAFAVWTVRRDAPARVAAAAYAALTAVIVMATANHYFLDVVGGTLSAGAALGAAIWLGRRRIGPPPTIPGQLVGHPNHG